MVTISLITRFNLTIFIMRLSYSVSIVADFELSSLPILGVSGDVLSGALCATLWF